ncbi:DegV family protein [Lachnospiraceae bacterium 62-35]
MKPIGIVTDSHSGITQEQAEEAGIYVLPMPFYIDGVCYYEDITLSREEFFKRLNSGARITTSQPALGEVMEIWDKALNEYEQILYIPISSGLSGSCAAAMTLSQEEEYRGRVFVVDNGRVSTPLHRSVLDALEMIKEGFSAEEIQKALYEAREQMVIYVGVQTLEHLKRGGRITAAAAAVGTILNIKPVLRFDVGALDSFKKCRGFLKARKVMIEAMKHDLETKFKQWYDRGEVYLLAASSSAIEDTKSWICEIQEAFPSLEVMCDNLSLGVSCHIGFGGLGIGCSCRPSRQKKKQMA